MNTLVYRDQQNYFTQSVCSPNHNTSSFKLDQTLPNAVFERITNREIEEKQQERTGEIGEVPLTFNEWLRRKEAEARMKKKLIQEAKKDIKQEMFEMAQLEQVEFDVK